MSILKKIFFLSLFFFILSLLFWGIYQLAFQGANLNTSSKPTFSDENSGQKPTSDPKTQVGMIYQVSKEAVLAPTLSISGDSVDYFSQESGALSQIDFYGNVQKNISSENIPNLLDAFWSIDKSKTIIETGDKNSPSFSLYDISTQATTPLKNNLDEVVWQNNANRILYKYYDAKTKERTLNVSDPDGNNWTKIADVGYKNLSISQIPHTGLISFWNSGDAYLQTNFQSVPTAGGAVKTLLTTGFGADYLWSDSGDWVLVSRTTSQGGSKMELGIMNDNGGEYKNLGVPTFTSKCAWAKDGRIIYYALPGGIPDNAVLPNDYKAEKFKTTDTFWKIDVSTGEKTRLVEIMDIAGQYDADGLFLNQSESLLFFVNKLDGKLYKIAL